MSTRNTERALTLEEIDLCTKDHARYQGFDTAKTCTEWARKLGISRVSFWCHLHKDGLTVEETFAKYGQPNGRKERPDTHRARTQKAVWLLLLESGYLVEEADVGVEYGKKTELLVSLFGSPLGVYNYATDTLTLPSGQGLKLQEPLVDLQRIRKGAGGWGLHPETQADLVNLALSCCAGEPTEDEYNYI